MLESWIADRPFREAHPPGQSDLDVARGTHARETLQDHWRNWIVESDWAWLAETGINTVRIPVSLLTFSHPSPRVRPVVPPAFSREIPSPLPSSRLRPDAKRSHVLPFAFRFCSSVFSKRPIILGGENLVDPEAKFTSDWFLSRLWRRSFCAAWHRVRRLCIRFR